MGVDSRAAAACQGLCAPREELLLLWPGQRPGARRFTRVAAVARAAPCFLPTVVLVYADCFWRETADCTSTGRRESQPSAARSGLRARKDRCGQSGFCKRDPFPFFLSSDATEILTCSRNMEFCPLCAHLPIASLVKSRDRAVPTVAATPSGHRRISPRGYGQVGQMGLTSFSLSQP